MKNQAARFCVKTCRVKKVRIRQAEMSTGQSSFGGAGRGGAQSMCKTEMGTMQDDVLALGETI